MFLLAQIPSFFFTVCPWIQIFNYYFMLLPFKSHRKKQQQGKNMLILTFKFTYVVNQCFFSCNIDLNYCLVSFNFSLKNSFQHLLQVRSTSNDLSLVFFFFSGNGLISPLLLKDSFADYRIIGWQFGFFLSLSALSYVTPLPSGLRGFWEDIISWP